MDYYEWNITLEPLEPWNEVIVAELGDMGFDSFVQTEMGVQAYVPANTFQDIDTLRLKVMQDFQERADFCSIQQELIPHQNWNAEWEAHFEPVFVEDLLIIRAPFHQVESANADTICVTVQPQMSFGTGHHQTTWLMSKTMFALMVSGKKVLDLGSGTGVLAILSEKLGAAEVLGVDIEAWSVENAVENAAKNDCDHCRFVLGDIESIENLRFDCILANINMNVLLRHLPDYSKALPSGGDLLLSGFFETDIPQLRLAAMGYDLELMAQFTKDEWACLHLKKK